MYLPESSRPQTEAEVYHRLLTHNKHILLQVKMYVIFFVGGVIIIICVVYIFFQCKSNVAKPPKRQISNTRTPKENKKNVFDPNDTLEKLLPSNTNIVCPKIRKDKEFYV